MVGRRKEEEEGDVFVELNHLMAVELMLLCILEGGREGALNVLGSQVMPLHTTLKTEGPLLKRPS